MNRISVCLLLLLTLYVPVLAEITIPAAGGDPTAIRPLPPGQFLPVASPTTAEGKPQKLPEALSGKPALLVFYCGGWCPFCTRQLVELKELLPELQKLNVPPLAISPDQPAKLKEFIDKEQPGFQLLSDSRMSLARDCGIAFRIDDATREKYKGYKIYLQAASGEDHFQLPVPTVFLIDAEGKIVFSYSNPDYKIRLSPEVILAAIKTMLLSSASGLPDSVWRSSG